jgi:indolepyruvate ferredoxin oxidoreductase beta subunit
MTARAIKIAVMALGGQGGGVLAEWIVKAGERAGFLAQSTSVPGVAQRTGATIYYVELFPKSIADEKGAAPILALMPAPGDVDILIAAEMMEAGRALARGFLSARTTLIASTHRIYAIGEKIAMSDGRQDAATVRAAVDTAVGRAIWFDMEKAAEDAGAVISAVMLGALAGSGAAPIGREIFEAEIRAGGRAVERNLKGFAAGFEAAGGGVVHDKEAPTSQEGVPAGPAVAPLLDRLSRLPARVQTTAREGVKRAVDFQDVRYGALYLDRLEKVIAVDLKNGGEARSLKLSKAIAKYLALAMAYDDVIRVADLKTRASRFHRFRDDVRAEGDQIVRVFEYMHPRIEEICDLLPPLLARALLRSNAARRAFDAVLGKGRRVATSDLSGFLTLYFLASLRALRRIGFRYSEENARIENWLALIAAEAPSDYALACEIASLQRLIKGYSDTHARGLSNFRSIMSALAGVKAAPDPAATLARLRDAALKDEDGAALNAALSKLQMRTAA